MSINNTEALQIVPVTDVDELNQSQLDAAVGTYQRAFELPPYEEAFLYDETVDALRSILAKGGDLNLITGQAEDEIVAIAGGFMKGESTYYIEELAVDPDRQGQGIGRFALGSLIQSALRREPSAIEIRTTVRNDKAIGLYGSEGFVAQDVTEVAAQARQDGKIALDERVYLLKEMKRDVMEKPKSLKRAAIAYPSGNTTAVVFDQMLESNREELNSDVMSAWKDIAAEQPEIEQCCFVTLPKDQSAVARVEMFGGEFCGNATRSVIQLITKGSDYQGLIEVSGVDRPLNFSVSSGDIAVEMPLPQNGELAATVEEGVLVQLDGIAQLVVTDVQLQQLQSPRELLNKLLAENKYGLTDQPAVGVSYYDASTNAAEFGVWVKEVNTVFDETACGSGTCAIGIASALSNEQTQTLNVIQPSGEGIVTEALFDSESGKVVVSNISGKVAVLYDGELELS